MMRPLVFAVAIAVLAGPALAQSTSPEDVDKLKRMLDEKFGSPSRTRGSAKPQKQLKQEDFYSIQRDGGDRQQTTTPPGKRSVLDLPGALMAIAPAHAGPGDVAQADTRRGSRRLEVKRDSYVILLKGNLTDQQLDAAIATLRDKYGLEVTRHTRLGEIYVSPSRETGTRSVGVEPKTLGSALEPKIIKDLRKEPFVEAAYVDFVVSPKSLPRRIDTTVKSGAGATVSWNWRLGEASDGNWGLKLMRMPPVWSILQRVRKIDPDRKRTRMAFLDAGFGVHGHLAYNEVLGGMPARPAMASCELSHGTHVAGIAGALFGKGRGIDGMIPDSKIDAIPVSAQLWVEGANLGLKRISQQVTLFTGAIESLLDFIEQYPLKPGEKRVVNVSLGYNWSALGFEFGKDAVEDDNIKTHILNTSSTVRRLADKYRDSLLIVAAAGNDSDGAASPHLAEFATPFGFAALHESDTYRKASNILVVEAVDRIGARAAFSNVGGHVSAPGVDIMSTLAGVNDAYGLCSGTSQATPHVTALAAILFELDPQKTPTEIAEIIRSSAIPGQQGSAPRVDALGAVFKLSKDNLKYLVDLNGDGNFDSADLEIIKTHLILIEEARAKGANIPIDLNGDGDVDNLEQCWPLIDFAGRGKAAYLDAAAAAPQPRTNLQILEEAWSDKTKPFATAMSEVGLTQLIDQWKAARSNPLTASVPGSGMACK
jgi:subtilisin family serine protease